MARHRVVVCVAWCVLTPVGEMVSWYGAPTSWHPSSTYSTLRFGGSFTQSLIKSRQCLDSVNCGIDVNAKIIKTRDQVSFLRRALCSRDGKRSVFSLRDLPRFLSGGCCPSVVSSLEESQGDFPGAASPIAAAPSPRRLPPVSSLSFYLYFLPFGPRNSKFYLADFLSISSKTITRQRKAFPRV